MFWLHMLRRILVAGSGSEREEIAAIVSVLMDELYDLKYGKDGSE